MPTIFETLGSEKIAAIISEFYDRAFQDPIIGHIFWGFDKDHLSQMQTSFASAMLGGPEKYRGKSLEAAHTGLRINKAHFGRRQVLMKEVLDDFEVDPEIARRWLLKEEKLKPLVISSDSNCKS